MDLSRTKCYSGLTNLGNTCFLNSCLQALNHTYELSAILDVVALGNCEKFTILKEWNNLRHLMWKQDAAISPQRFVANVHNIAQKKRQGTVYWVESKRYARIPFIYDRMRSRSDRS